MCSESAASAACHRVCSARPDEGRRALKTEEAARTDGLSYGCGGDCRIVNAGIAAARSPFPIAALEKRVKRLEKRVKRNERARGEFVAWGERADLMSLDVLA